MARKRVVRESVNIYEAKTTLSELVERAATGEEIIIAKAGKPKARLVPLESAPLQRVPGHGKAQWTVADDFDAPLPDDVLERFEGKRR
ncbi:MAG: type II toxin-antitoxin system Phd/YefM family antitoxin [Gemmatimonadales bacterium]|nr:type II toxin-antitoxin system Phd/YefM family antitoxin [Gemmatimonadales bacterium]